MSSAFVKTRTLAPARRTTETPRETSFTRVTNTTSDPFGDHAGYVGDCRVTGNENVDIVAVCPRDEEVVSGGDRTSWEDHETVRLTDKSATLKRHISGRPCLCGGQASSGRRRRHHR